MKCAHTIKIGVFAKPEDDKEEVKKTLISLIPFDLEGEKIILKEQKADSFEDRTIIIYEVVLEKEKDTNRFLELLKKKLSKDQKEMIIRQLTTRIDEELYFYLRFDKDKLMKENVFCITDSGNCFHIKMSVAAFPKRLDSAMIVLRKIFG